jgi:hypothetical protein
VFFLGHATLRCIGDPLAPATAPSLLGCFSTILEGEHLHLEPFVVGLPQQTRLVASLAGQKQQAVQAILVVENRFWRHVVDRRALRLFGLHPLQACAFVSSLPHSRFLLNTAFACIQYGADYASGAKSGGMRELHILLLKMAPSIQRTLVCQVAVDREMSGLPASNH